MNFLPIFLDAFLDFTATGRIRSRCTATDDKTFVHPPVPRLIAIGDLHGDVEAAQNAFEVAGLVDKHGNWCGKETVCVQIGDLLDRGHDEIKLLHWMEHVASDAERHGGKVIILNGNHEYMNVQGGYRYASQKGALDFDAYAKTFNFVNTLKGKCGFPTSPLKDVPDTIPQAMRARFASMQPGAPLALRFFSNKNTVVRVGDTFFVHAGVLPHHVEYGLERINEEAKAWVAGVPGSHRPRHLWSRDSLVWTRLFSDTDPSKIDCDPLFETFKLTGAKRMVIGHSVQPRITSRCNAGAISIDVGMSAHVRGGNPQVLEIINDSEVRVLSRPPSGDAAHKVEEVHKDPSS